MPIANHLASAVIDLEFFAGRSLDYRTGVRRLLPTELTNEPFDALIVARETMSIHQILPDGFGVATSVKTHFNGFPIGFGGAGGGASAQFRFCFRRGFSGRFHDRAGGHLLGLTGRFCRRGGGHHAGLTGRFCPDSAAARWSQRNPSLFQISRDGLAADAGFHLNPSQRPSQAP